MLEIPHPECHALDPLDEVVDGFGGSVRDVGSVPGDDLVAPAGDRAAKAADLVGHLAVGEVAHDLVDPLGRELVVGVVVDLADDFLSHNRPWVPVMSMVRWRAVDAEKTRVGRLSWVLVCRCSAVVID